MKGNLLKKGDKVVMHTCIEAEKYNGKIWTCKTDEYTKGEGVYKQNLVFLEGFSGCFATEFLQKINLSSLYNIGEHKVDDGNSRCIKCGDKIEGGYCSCYNTKG